MAQWLAPWQLHADDLPLSLEFQISLWGALESKDLSMLESCICEQINIRVWPSTGFRCVLSEQYNRGSIYLHLQC